ncbi:hypothetical protein Cni_G14302 [Canna indica]|uniref:BRCT domain-containing protein n=1 Tax=Canna indica TaxID=4628 RepID=A0AAQ3KEJ4_9LILI|nr:hypothetical protein Cni_G14302 [Canna indica]
MTDFRYRSPQFSEDAAWLPPWLQPALGDCKDKEPSNSLLQCEDATCFEENINNRNNAPPFLECAKYTVSFISNSIIIVLSKGSDMHKNSYPSKIVAPFYQALHLQLHLSLDDVSANTTGPLNEVHQAGKDDKKLLLTQELIPENPITQGETSGQQHKEVGAVAQDTSPLGTLSMPEEIIVKPLKKNDQKNLQRWDGSDGEPDDDRPKKPDVNDAIELCIAASEAIAISDIVSNNQVDSFATSNILKIVLRMKDMRNTCYLGLEADSNSANEIDESDQLLDLDEHIMEDAYSDVGFSITQIANSHKNLSFRRDSSQDTSDSLIKEQVFFQSSSLCDTNTHISETPCQYNGESAKIDEFETHQPENNGRTFQNYDTFVSKRKNFSSEPLTTPRARPVCASVFPILPDQNNRSITPIQIAKTPDDIAKIRMSSKGPQEIILDGKISRKGNTFLRKSMKGLLNWETSYISESNDDMSGNQLQQIQEPRPEEISSSSTPNNVSVCSYKGKDEYLEGRASNNLVKSSNVSLVDPICSFVPCSIGSDDAPKAVNCTQKMIGEDVQLSNERFIGEISSSQRFMSSNNFNQLAQPDCDPSKFTFSSIPICKQFKFPNPHRAFMLDFNSAKKAMLATEQVPLPSITEKNSELFPAEINKSTYDFFEDESVALKGMKKCGEVSAPYADRSKHGHKLISKDQENIGLSPVLETEPDELVVLNDEHEKIFVNIKKRRHQACQIVVNNDDRGVKRHSALGMTKHLNSSDKRVCLLDPKCVNQYHGITNRRSKEFSSLCKSQTRNEIYKPGTRCIIDRKEMIFFGLEFLLTGFSGQKEKELETLISQYGGHVLPTIPVNRPNLMERWKMDSGIKKHPIVLSPKKVKTTKFLYGCAINTWTLKASWLHDSVQSGSILQPWKYMIRPIQLTPRQLLRTDDILGIEDHFSIFKQLGVMLHGKVNFYTKFSKIIKYGGGQVFKSLQQLIQSLKIKKNTFGVVLVESEADISRHLKHCVSEYDLQIAPVSWIVNSLFSGKLLPLKKDRCAPLRRIKVPLFPMDLSQEI